jgi:crossover junction endodeoxyribonuclease RuvC
MTILGIDPGSQLFGLSLLEKEANRVRFVESRLLRLGTGDLLARMTDLVQQLELFFDEHGVNQAAIEDGFLGKNVKTVEILARIRGVVITLLIQRRIPVFLYPPRTVKLAVTGYGNADKAQTRKALSVYMGRDVDALTDDESDALAIAYCHFLKG